MNPITYNTVILILFANTAYFSLFVVAGDPTSPEELPENNKPKENEVIIDIANLDTPVAAGYRKTTVANEDEIVPEEGYVITKVVDNNVDIFTAGNNKIVRIYIPKLTTNNIVDIVLSDTKHCCFEKQNNAYVEVSLFEILRNREKTEKYTVNMRYQYMPKTILSMKSFRWIDMFDPISPFTDLEKIVYDDEVIMDNTNFYLTGAAGYRVIHTYLIHVCFITKDNKRGEKYFMRKLKEEESHREVSVEEGIKFLRTINSSIPEGYVPESNGFMNVALYFMLAVSTALFVF